MQIKHCTWCNYILFYFLLLFSFLWRVDPPRSIPLFLCLQHVIRTSQICFCSPGPRCCSAGETTAGHDQIIELCHMVMDCSSRFTVTQYLTDGRTAWRVSVSWMCLAETKQNSRMPTLFKSVSQTHISTPQDRVEERARIIMAEFSEVICLHWKPEKPPV